jgi:hypothetical protein
MALTTNTKKAPHGVALGDIGTESLQKQRHLTMGNARIHKHIAMGNKPQAFIESEGM